MPTPVLFLQGGSDGAYDADAELAASLRESLGQDYDVRYPALPNEGDPKYSAWKKRIETELKAMGDGAILVGHSIGGSVAIKLLTENPPPLAAAFIISAPFWYDDDFWHWTEAQLPRDAATRLPKALPLFFYHGSDDESVPVSHLDMYAKAFPQATIRPVEGRGHQLDNDLGDVARDIQALTPAS